MKSLRNWPLTYGEPNWVPLEAALAPEQREDYMYMGQAGPIVLYKHRWTRRYLNIGLDGLTFSGTPMRVMKRLTARTLWTSHVLESGKEEAMAKGINKAMLLGHVGKDPEIRSTTGGTLVATFSLATAERQKDGQGNWSDRTEWHNLVAFNRTAEVIRDYVKKGTQLFIEGKSKLVPGTIRRLARSSIALRS